MEKVKVQTLIRSIPGIKWIPGFSKIYKDPNYSRTAKRVRYNFEEFYYDGDLDANALEKKIVETLTSSGHAIECIQSNLYEVNGRNLVCLKNEIEVSDTVRELWLRIYQEFPIQIVEI